MSLDRQILALAIPSVIANITTPLLGLVDTTVTGHLGGDVYIAAVAVATSLFNLMYFPMAFLRMGTSGMTAQATGRSDTPAQAAILYRGLSVALLASAVIITLQSPLLRVLLLFMDTDAATSRLVSGYFSVVIWGAPAVLGTYAMTGWLLGMQSSRKPMVISIAINVVNILLSPALAFWGGMKLQGVAVGTLSAQWAGFLIGLYMCSRYRPVWQTRDIFDRSHLRRFFKLNSDIFLRTLCLMAVTVWFTREGARMSESILAANALMMQFFILFSYMSDGFAYAGEALTGRLTGERDFPALRLCVSKLLKWGLMMSLLFTVAYFVAGEKILSLLTDSRTVIDVARDYLPWAATVPLAGFMAFTWDGVFIGTTSTRAMLIAMFFAMLTFFGIYYSLRASLGNHALWLAFVSYLLVRGVIQTLLWPRILRKLTASSRQG